MLIIWWDLKSQTKTIKSLVDNFQMQALNQINECIKVKIWNFFFFFLAFLRSQSCI